MWLVLMQQGKIGQDTDRPRTSISIREWIGTLVFRYQRKTKKYGFGGMEHAQAAYLCPEFDLTF